MDRLYEGFMYTAEEGSSYWVQTIEQLQQTCENYYWVGVIAGTVFTLAALGALIIISNLVVELRKKWYTYSINKLKEFDSYVEKTR